jgi:hypothetical protein
MRRERLLDGARWVLAVLWVAGLGLHGYSALRRGTMGADWIEGTGVQSLAVGFGAMGVLLTLRRRDHLVGWLMLGFASCFAVRLGLEEWTVWHSSLDQTYDASLGVLGINLTAVAMGIPLILLMGVFPHDRLPRGRSRWMLIGAVGVSLLGLPATPIIGYEAPGVMLPPAVAGYEDAANALAFFGFVPLAVMMGVLPIRLGRLLLRGDPIERLQIRWLVFVLTVMIALLAVTPLIPGANRVAGLVAGVGVPGAIWIAITRHGLYEIDRIISRTLGYALVAVVLAAVFAAGAIALPQFLPPDSSKFAVATTTLAAAALFSPLRRRSLALVERRFHRLPYVADDVVDALTRRLRGEVQPGAVLDEFSIAIWGALSPASVSVWIADSRNDFGTGYV